MNVISEWLAPLPDKSLPALEIRTDLLKILQDFNRLEPGTLKQSGLGRAVMLLYKHPRETKENKALAARLISDWARPIFQVCNFLFLIFPRYTLHFLMNYFNNYEVPCVFSKKPYTDTASR